MQGAVFDWIILCLRWNSVGDQLLFKERGVTTLGSYLQRKLKLISSLFFSYSLSLLEGKSLSEMCNVQHAFKIRFVFCHNNGTYSSSHVCNWTNCLKCLTDTRTINSAMIAFYCSWVSRARIGDLLTNTMVKIPLIFGVFLIHGSITPPSTTKENPTIQEQLWLLPFKTPCRVLLVNLLHFLLQR